MNFDLAETGYVCSVNKKENKLYDRKSNRPRHNTFARTCLCIKLHIFVSIGSIDCRDSLEVISMVNLLVYSMKYTRNAYTLDWVNALYFVCLRGFF